MHVELSLPENPINYLEDDDITKMVAMGIGCVAGMVLIIGTAFIIRRRSLCEEKEPITGEYAYNVLAVQLYSETPIIGPPSGTT